MKGWEMTEEEIEEIQHDPSYHTCPYMEDINGDSRKWCDCSEYETELCAMEI